MTTHNTAAAAQFDNTADTGDTNLIDSAKPTVLYPASPELEAALKHINSVNAVDDLFNEDAAVAYLRLKKANKPNDVKRWNNAAKERFYKDGFRQKEWNEYTDAIKKGMPEFASDIVEKPTIVHAILEYARKHATFFRTPNGVCYAKVDMDDHTEIMDLTIAGGSFKAWLTHSFEQNATTPTTNGINNAMQVLYAQAKMGGIVEPVYRRIGWTEDKKTLAIDLCDKECRYVIVDEHGWRVAMESPVNFIREDDEMPMPVPVTGGKAEDVFRFLNANSEADKKLMLSWLIGCYQPDGPYAVMGLYGTPGSAKSTTQRVLRKLIDFRDDAGKMQPKNDHDVIVGAEKTHVVAYENLNRLSADLSDIFCMISTGLHSSTRGLFTDRDEQHFHICAPVLFNSIENLSLRPDLISRAIIINLPKVHSGSKRYIGEKHINREFNREWPRIWGGVLDAVVAALKNIAATEDNEHDIRMADFANWIAAACPALGWSVDEWNAAYKANLRDARQNELASSVFGTAVMEFLGGEEWIRRQLIKSSHSYDRTFTCPDDCKIKSHQQTRSYYINDLLSALKEGFLDGEGIRRANTKGSGWPQTPGHAKTAFENLSHAFESMGVVTNTDVKRGNKGDKVIIDWSQMACDERATPSYEAVQRLLGLHAATVLSSHEIDDIRAIAAELNVKPDKVEETIKKMATPTSKEQDIARDAQKLLADVPTSGWQWQTRIEHEQELREKWARDSGFESVAECEAWEAQQKKDREARIAWLKLRVEAREAGYGEDIEAYKADKAVKDAAENAAEEIRSAEERRIEEGKYRAQFMRDLEASQDAQRAIDLAARGNHRYGADCVDCDTCDKCLTCGVCKCHDDD